MFEWFLGTSSSTAPVGVCVIHWFFGRELEQVFDGHTFDTFRCWAGQWPMNIADCSKGVD